MPNKDKSPFITTSERIANYIALGFVLSLLLHLVLAPLLPNLNKHHETAQVQQVTVGKKTPPPTPPPTPKPTPTPPPPKTTPPPHQQVQQQPRLRVNPPKTTNSGNAPASTNKYIPQAGSESGVPQGQGTAPPAAQTASPTATPATCANPNHEATVTNQATASYPQSAQDLNLGTVNVTVVVSLTANGSLTDAKIQQSGNNFAIDRAALEAARNSSYAPKVVNCVPVASKYIFAVTFSEGN